MKYSQPYLTFLNTLPQGLMTLVGEEGLNLLNCLKTDVAILYVSHRLHTLANFCDCIYILDEGKLVTSGSHEILLETDNMYSGFGNIWNRNYWLGNSFVCLQIVLDYKFIMFEIRCLIEY